MSIEITAYTPALLKDYMPAVVHRLNDFEMECEAHPESKFDTDNQGYMPFRFRLTNPCFGELCQKELISGFELFADDFDLQAAKHDLGLFTPQPKRSVMNYLFGNPPPPPPDPAFAPPAIEERLKNCTMSFTFVWHTGDDFEMRFACLVSALLAELTGGALHYPADDIWYEPATMAADAWKEVQQYEQSVPVEKLKYHEFEGWG